MKITNNLSTGAELVLVNGSVILKKGQSAIIPDNMGEHVSVQMAIAKGWVTVDGKEDLVKIQILDEDGKEVVEEVKPKGGRGKKAAAVEDEPKAEAPAGGESSEA